MSLYTQIAYHPIIFQVDSNNVSTVKEILDSKKLSFKHVLLLTGESHSYKIAKENEFEFIDSHKIVRNNSFEEVERLSNIVYENKYDLIIGLGGGKVLDVTKKISLNERVNHISIPTIISNDGLISPISVLSNNKGYSESVPGQMPMGVIIDLEIISTSPKKYLKAAAGDILSNMSATNDWDYAEKMHKEVINDIAFQLSRMSAHSLIYFKDIDLNSETFLKMVIQGQVNSGIAMGLAGTSRPCSGSEHLLSHAIDFLELSESSLHGTQVASASLFTLYLQEKLKKQHIEYALKTGIPVNFTNILENKDEETLRTLYRKSKEMRPGRVTILDAVNEGEFVEKIHEYRIFLETTLNLA